MLIDSERSSLGREASLARVLPTIQLVAPAQSAKQLSNPEAASPLVVGILPAVSTMNQDGHATSQKFVGYHLMEYWIGGDTGKWNRLPKVWKAIRL